MLDSLITSKTRIKLLLKFFLNPNLTSYLRNLETEFGESSNSIRIELNRFEKAKLLLSNKEGNKKIFKANIKHPIYADINKILLKQTGLEQIIERVVKQVGDMKEVYVFGDLAKGRNVRIIELIFVGDQMNIDYLSNLIEKAEKLIKRKIHFLIYEVNEFREIKKKYKSNEILMLWNEG